MHTAFFEDVQRNLVVYATRSPLLFKHIPDAKAINGEFAALPKTLRNLQVLRWLNFPVPPIITDANYDWPRSKRIKHPYDAQKLAANFLVIHRRAFNLSDLGAGKTLTALWAADWLLQQHEDWACLVVAPLSTLELVWQNSIFEHFLDRYKVEILHGTPTQRLKALDKKARINIINYDGLGVGAHTRGRLELDGFSKALAARDDIKIVIVDEATAYKDASIDRHRIARKIIGAQDYLWLMTGTPTPSKPTDAYGLAKMVNNAFGKSFTQFRGESMIKVSTHIWKPQRDGYQKARQLLQPAIRIDIKEIWDAPPMTVQQRQVALTPIQTEKLNELKRNLQITLKSGQPITAVNEAAERTKFLQIVQGEVYDAAHKAHTVDATPRYAELHELIEQAPAKVLVFAGLTSVVLQTTKYLKKLWPTEVVYGDTSPANRTRIFQAFQREPNPRILVAHPGTMAHGIELWMAQTVCWFGPLDKTELYLQANKRAHRPGQKYPVAVVQLVATKLEQEIFRRLDHNETMQGALLDMVRRGEL